MIEMPENRSDPIDALLDRALASYTPAASRPGLESRIEARLDAASPAPRRAFSLWLIPAAALAAAVVLGAVLLHFRAPSAPPNHAQVHPAASLPAPAVPWLLATAPPSRPAQASHAAVASQPTQSQLIGQLLAKDPEAIASLAQAEDEQDKPIAVQPIHDDPLTIEPIQIPPIDDNPGAPTGATKETQ